MGKQKGAMQMLLLEWEIKCEVLMLVKIQLMVIGTCRLENQKPAPTYFILDTCVLVQTYTDCMNEVLH